MARPISLPRRAEAAILGVCCALALLVLLNTSVVARPIIGTNGHDNWTTGPYGMDKEERVFQTLSSHAFRTYRIDVNADSTSGETLERLVALGRKYHVVIRPMLYVDNLTTKNAYKIMRQFAHEIPIWEFGNELNLRGPLSFDDSIAKMKIARAALEKVSLDTGIRLKSAVNVAAFAGPSGKGLNLFRSSYGFLERDVAQGLAFDYITFHYYPSPTDQSSGWIETYLDPLRAYGKPVILNETNCSNIYRGDDGNSDACAATLRSLIEHVFAHFDDMVVEIDTYELLDDPSQKGAEAHFGMMFDLDHPKQTLSLVTGYARLTEADSAPQ